MKPWSIAVLLMLTLAACTAQGVATEPMSPDAGDPIVDTVHLSVVPPDASTYWSSIPVSGQGPADGTLLYTTPGGGQFTATLGASGDFCVDVVLMKNATNTIKFEAIDASGEYADPVLIDVRQSGDAPGSGPPDPPTSGYRNIAAGSTIEKMSVSIEEGSVAALVDGDSSGVVSIRNTTSSSDWMVIELGERLPIQQFRVKTSSDCPMETYRILLNDDAQSDDPIAYSWIAGKNVYGNGWTIVGDVTNGTADQTIAPFIGDPLAQRMAIEFLSSDCGPFIGSGRHRVTEIEVWGRSDGQSGGGSGSGSGAPSCSSL